MTKYKILSCLFAILMFLSACSDCKKSSRIEHYSGVVVAVEWHRNPYRYFQVEANDGVVKTFSNLCNDELPVWKGEKVYITFVYDEYNVDPDGNYRSCFNIIEAREMK